jgi:hypothetical protein
MRQKRPVIATGYSGNMDFMNERNSYLCRFEMAPVGTGSPPYSPKALWAEPDVAHAAELMRHVYTHPEEAAERGRFAAEDLAERFSPQRCAEAVEIRWRELRSIEIQSGNGLGLVSSNGHLASYSSQLKTLHKQWKRAFNGKDTIPSLGTILFQGPQKILKKMLLRREKQRKPFDEALVLVTSSHDRRLTNMENAVRELREQNAMLLDALSASRKDTPRLNGHSR